jgi:DNA invertase Pin-like site-specific DNA recombinase
MREPRRCAIYSRFSGDMRHDPSLTGQISECRQHAERKGWEIVEQHVESEQDNAVGRAKGDAR